MIKYNIFINNSLRGQATKPNKSDDTWWTITFNGKWWGDTFGNVNDMKRVFRQHYPKAKYKKVN